MSSGASVAVLQRLEEQCKDVHEAQAATVEIETSMLGSVVECLREAADTQRQLELAQEQLTMKPSVAKKLNDRIKALETELSITRKRSNIAELEKKVARLEIELRQSYSTKNFTLKSGLLDIEKKHREFIYDNPAIEDLWTEVLGLLVEDKEALPAGTVIQKAKVNQKYRRSSSAGVATNSGLPNGLPSAAPDASPPLDNRSLNRVQDEIEKLEEHVTGVPLLPPPQPTAAWRGFSSIGSKSFSNPAFCWYADLGVGRTATTVQQHIDTLNTAVASLQTELKGMGLLEQPPTPLSTPPPTSKSQQQQQQQQQQQEQTQQQAMGSPEAVCNGMEALSVSVQHLLELLPSASGESGAGNEDSYEALQATINMEFTSFDKQAEEVLYCMEQLSMAFGTLQAQNARKQHQASSGGTAAGAALAGGSDESSGAEGAQQTQESAKDFYKQASALTNAVQQLRALLSVHMQRAQQRLRDMATPPMAPTTKASAGVSSTPAAQQQEQQQQQEGAAGMPPGTVQALASRFLSFLISNGHLPTSPAHQQQHSAQHAQHDPHAVGIAGTSLEQLLQDFVASQYAASSLPVTSHRSKEGLVAGGSLAGDNNTSSSGGQGRDGGKATGLPPLPPSNAKPLHEEAATTTSQNPVSRTSLSGGLVLEEPSSERLSTVATNHEPFRNIAAAASGDMLSRATSVDPSNLSASGLTTPQGTERTSSWGNVSPEASAPVRMPSEGDVGLEAPGTGHGAVPGAEQGGAPGAEPCGVVNYTDPGKASAAEPGAVPGAKSEAGLGAASTAVPGGAWEGEVATVEVPSANAATHQRVPSTAEPDRSVASEVTDTRAELADQGGAGLEAGAHVSSEGGVYGEFSLAEPTAGEQAGHPVGLEQDSAMAEATAGEQAGLPAGMERDSAILGVVREGHAQPEESTPATPGQHVSSSAQDAAQQQNGQSQDQQQQQQGDHWQDYRHQQQQQQQVWEGQQQVQGLDKELQQLQQQQQQQQEQQQQEQQQQQQHMGHRKMQDVGLGPMSPRSPMSPHTPSYRESRSEILPEDYAAEIDQLRAIAAHHAEITASSQELVASLSAQHTAAMMRADELEARLAQFEKEVQMQMNENEVLTRALVEVKVAFAEKDSENMRLAQRLKRSLKNSDVSREEIEYLKSRLMAVTPDQVGVEADELEDIKAAVQEASTLPRSDTRKSTVETEVSVKGSETTDAPESPVPLD